MKILFSKKDHKYQKGDTVYTSVSKIVGNFKNEFDSDHWSTYKAIESLLSPEDFKSLKKGWDVSKPEFIIHALHHVDEKEVIKATKNILKDWEKKNKKSINKGNKYHDIRERRSYRNGYELNPFDNKKYIIPMKEVQLINPEVSPEYKENLIDDLFMLPDGYYPELLLWNEECKVAGQADKVFIETINNERHVDIDDYKTNRKIKTKSGYIKTKNDYARMKPPLGHLMDCNHSHYNLQISLYGWILEQVGFKVRNLAFHHYNKAYYLDYLKDDVEAMLRELKLLGKRIENEI